jgi:hypothetical protein
LPVLGEIGPNGRVDARREAGYTFLKRRLSYPVLADPSSTLRANLRILDLNQ